MAAVTEEVERGALFDLQRLQEKADKLNTESKAAVQEQTKLADLQKEVQQLREKRDKLQERLKKGPHEIIQEYLQKGQKSKRKYTESQRESIVTAVRSLRKRKLTDLCDAYRLVGISLAAQEAETSCFRCETFFNSRYYEPYYIEVESKDKYTIHKHTLPYFIPIDAIGEEYLNSDIKKFFMVITEYLNAFVARREQVHLCQEQHQDKLKKELSCSPAYDFIQLTTKAIDEQEANFVVKLTFDKLTQTLPSAVDLHSEGKKTLVSQQSLRAKKKLFKDLPLNKAFAKAFT